MQGIWRFWCASTVLQAFTLKYNLSSFCLALTCWPPAKRHSSCVLLYVKLLLPVISTFLDLNHSFGQHWDHPPPVLRLVKLMLTPTICRWPTSRKPYLYFVLAFHGNTFAVLQDLSRRFRPGVAQLVFFFKGFFQISSASSNSHTGKKQVTARYWYTP